jgi:hypothetical protein
LFSSLLHLDKEELIEVLVVQTIHLIRHGEGYHNIGMEGNLDAHLTPTGWKQAAALKAHIQKLEPQLGIQVGLPCFPSSGS